MTGIVNSCIKPNNEICITLCLLKNATINVHIFSFKNQNIT